MSRRTRTEIAALLALREQEGLSYAELSRRTGVNPRTLTWWNWRLRKDARVRRSDAFVQVAEAPATEQVARDRSDLLSRLVGR